MYAIDIAYYIKFYQMTVKICLLPFLHSCVIKNNIILDCKDGLKPIIINIKSKNDIKNTYLIVFLYLYMSLKALNLHP